MDRSALRRCILQPVKVKELAVRRRVHCEDMRPTRAAVVPSTQSPVVLRVWDWGSRADADAVDEAIPCRVKYAS